MRLLSIFVVGYIITLFQRNVSFLTSSALKGVCCPTIHLPMKIHLTNQLKQPRLVAYVPWHWKIHHLTGIPTLCKYRVCLLQGVVHPSIHPFIHPSLLSHWAGKGRPLRKAMHWPLSLSLFPNSPSAYQRHKTLYRGFSRRSVFEGRNKDKEESVPKMEKRGFVQLFAGAKKRFTHHTWSRG